MPRTERGGQTDIAREQTAARTTFRPPTSTPAPLLPSRKPHSGPTDGDNGRTANQQRSAKDAAPAPPEKKPNGEAPGSERRRDRRHEAAAQSRTIADFKKTPSRRSLGTLNELGPTVPSTPTVSPPESASLHPGAKQRKRPRARSLGTRAEWSETSAGDAAKDRQGTEAITADAAGGHADARAS